MTNREFWRFFTGSGGREIATVQAVKVVERVQRIPGAIEILPPQQDRRRYIGDPRYCATEIKDPAFRVSTTLHGHFKDTPASVLLNIGTYYGLEDALTHLSTSHISDIAGVQKGHYDWCRGWPVKVYRVWRGGEYHYFAAGIDLRRQKLFTYRIPQVQRVTVTQTITRTIRR